MNDGMRFDAVLKRDRTIVLLGLASVAVPVWVYVWRLLEDDTHAIMAMGASISDRPVWPGFDLGPAFAMWAAMMVAMMLPSITLVVLMFASITRKRDLRQSPFVSTTAFLLGYFAIWMGFSILATAIQWGLQIATSRFPGLTGISPVLSGLLLMTVGIFQWTPLKHACLNHCRSAQGFFLTEWREGVWGALCMGLTHGRYCLGCCWLLMGLFFLMGVMSLAWMAMLAAFVLLEKVVPAGQWVSRIAGILLVGWGIWMMTGALL